MIKLNSLKLTREKINKTCLQPIKLIFPFVNLTMDLVKHSFSAHIQSGSMCPSLHCTYTFISRPKVNIKIKTLLPLRSRVFTFYDTNASLL
jgi:hypothetical protein